MQQLLCDTCDHVTADWLCVAGSMLLVVLNLRLLPVVEVAWVNP